MENNYNKQVCNEVNRLVRLLDVKPEYADKLAQELRRDLCKMSWYNVEDKSRGKASYKKGEASIGGTIATNDGEKFPEVYALFSCLCALDSLCRKAEFKVWNAKEAKSSRDFTISFHWNSLPSSLRHHFRFIFEAESNPNAGEVNPPTVPVTAHVMQNAK